MKAIKFIDKIQNSIIFHRKVPNADVLINSLFDESVDIKVLDTENVCNDTIYHVLINGKIRKMSLNFILDLKWLNK